jgi:predicted GNAT family acetyltransferase
MPIDVNAFYGIETEEEEKARLRRERQSLFDMEASKNLQESLYKELGLTESPLAPDVTSEQNLMSVQQALSEDGYVPEEMISKEEPIKQPIEQQPEPRTRGGIGSFLFPEEEDIREQQSMEQSDLSNFFNRIARGVPELTVDLFKDYFTISDIVSDVQEFEPIGTHQLGRGMNQEVLSKFDVMLDEALPIKDHDEFYSALGSGIGSGLFFMAGGLAGRGLGLSASAISSLLGAGTMSQQMFEEAIESGASEEDAFVNFLSGGALGATEGLLGVGRILDNIGKRTGQSFIRQVFTGGIEESFQEGVQNLGQNLTAKETFDLSRSLLEGMGTSLGVAMITGGLFTSGGIAIQRMLANENTPNEDRALLEKAQENFDEVKAKYSVPSGDNLSYNTTKKIIDTHNTSGGSSTSINGETITDGYAVGISQGNGIAIKGTEITQSDLDNFARQNKTLLSNPDNFIGTWYNKQDGKTYIDVSTRVDNKDEAKELGKKNNQIAIYDLANDSEIAVESKEDLKLIKETTQNKIENEEIQRKEELRKKENDIPKERQLQLFHFSDVADNEMVTEPKRFGEHAFTKGDQRASTEPRTFFYTDPLRVMKDSPALRRKNMFITTVDAGKIYDLNKNEQNYGVDENGVKSLDKMIADAKANGWEGVRYPQGNQETVNMFNEQLLVRPDSAPSLADVVAGKWADRVAKAQEKLKDFGSQLYDVTSLLNPALAVSFVSNMSIVVADRIAHKNFGVQGGKLGSIAGFTRTLLDEYEQDFPIIRRYARDIYEKVKEIREAMKKNPLTMQESDEVMKVVREKLNKGELDEFIPTEQGVIILGGDILDFEGDRRRHIGLAYPEDQATRARYKKEIKVNESKPQYTAVLGEDELGIKLVSFNHPKGAIQARVKKDKRMEVDISMVSDEMRGTGLGGALYEAVIKYAKKNKIRVLGSDSSVSENAQKVWEGLRAKGYRVHKNPDTGFVGGTLVADNIGEPVYELDIRSTIGKRFPEESYSVWATDAGVARQIEKSANQGNDTLVFMAYPDAWNAIFSNYEFQKQLNALLVGQIGEENVPELVSKEDWEGRGSRVGVHPSSVTSEATWLQYEKDIKKAISDAIKINKDGIKKLKLVLKKASPSGKGGINAEINRLQENIDKLDNNALAMKFAIDNGINLKGKIVGVSKFRQVNRKRSVTQADAGDVRLKDERLVKHNLYDTEIEGYNYVPLEEPIDHRVLGAETEGTDVGMEGVIPAVEDEVKRETLRRTQIFRIIQQRGLTLTREQASIVDGLIDLASGNDAKLNEWVSNHPESKGEIPDPIAHADWLQRNKEKSERFRREADKELSQFLAPMSSGGFLNPDVWRGLTVVGKAVARGGKKFGKWSMEMIKQLGDWVRPILRSLWSHVTQTPSNIIKKPSKKELDHATDPNGQIQMMGKTEEQALAEHKRDMKADHRVGTLPSKTSGYNMANEHPRLGEVLVPTIEAMRAEFDVRRRGTIDNEELMKRAQKRAEKLTDRDILELDRGDIKNAEDVLAMRIYLTDQMLKVADEIRANASTGDGILIKNMSDELTRVMRMWHSVRALGTEAGRVVQSFNIPMDDQVMEAMRDMAGLMNQLDPEGRYGGDIIERMITKIINEKDEGKKQSKWQKAWEVGRFGFLNWILQNPLTDMANIHGNATNLSFHIVSNIGNLGGAKTLLRGIKMGVKEGTKNALEVLHGEREAISKFTEGSQVELPTAKGRKGKNWAKLLVPTTRLGMEDAFFRAMARNIETERMVVKTSMKLGVNPDEVSNAVSDIINNPEMEQYTRKEYVQLVRYLEQIEDELVFQQELGRFGKAMASASKVIFPIMPFVTTPANLLKAGVGATPLGLTKLLKADLSPEEKNQIIRRAVAGSVFMSGVVALIGQGLVEITGGGSDDEYERDLMEAMGYKPNHIYINTPWGKFGGGYLNINPIMTMFTVAGDILDKQRFRKFEKPSDEKAWHDKAIEDMTTAILGVATSISDQSFLLGVKQFMDFLSGRSPDWAMRMLTNFARVGSIQGIQRITGTEDRGRYETRGKALEQIQKNFPLASNEGLTESIGTFGEQRQSQYERFPVPVSEIAPKPALDFLIENGLRVRQPSDGTKLENRTMNEHELNFFRKGVGQLMAMAVEKLYMSQQPQEGKRIEELNEEELQDKLDDAYESAKKKVKKQLKKKLYKQYQLQEGVK